MIITIEFFKFELVEVPKSVAVFSLKQMKHTTIEFWMFELAFVSNFTLNKRFLIFGPNLPKEDIYGQE